MCSGIELDCDHAALGQESGCVQSRRRSELYELTPSQQNAIRAHCERIRLSDGIRWLKQEFRLRVSVSALRVWLCRKRAEHGQPNARKISGTLNRLTPGQQKALLAYCRKQTLAEGVEWLRREQQLDVSQASLSRWLARQRGARDTGMVRKPQGNAPLALLSSEQRERLFAVCDSGSLDDGRKWVWDHLGVDLSRSVMCEWRSQERTRRAVTVP